MEIKILQDGKVIKVLKEKDPITPLQIFKKHNLTSHYTLAAVKINNSLQNLNTLIKKNCFIEFLDISTREGSLVYKNSLKLVLIRVASEAFQDVKVEVKNSIADGYYIEIYSRFLLTESDTKKLKYKMLELIKKDEKFEVLKTNISEARKIFKNNPTRLQLLKNYNEEKIKIYKFGKIYDFSPEPLLPSTGSLTIFDLKYQPPGLILRFPSKIKPDRMGKFHKQPNLVKIFTEYTRWGNILNLRFVSSLNNAVDNFNINEIILTSEALHENKIFQIAREIYKKRKEKRLILISGPSSSGKTTFSKRLAIQLKVQGLSSLKISLDDYFLDRVDTPLHENGEYDFESIKALDKELIDSHISRLLQYKSVEVPKFNFRNGKREQAGHIEKLPEKDSILIIEGIHGLNDALTPSIDEEIKYKIYVSALTQLNLDNHNRISTSDTRILRRIVRDSHFRGYSAADTLNRWDSIKQGEQKYVFSFQEDSDIMFNSALVYELGVLKKYAIPELQSISSNSPQYSTTQRLIQLLQFFKDIPDDSIPKTSIIREYISGSIFNY